MLKLPSPNKLNWFASLGMLCLTLSLHACLTPPPTPAAAPTTPTPGQPPAAEEVTLPTPTHWTGVIRFKQLSLEAGLSQSVVNCLTQDRQGFLWLGTQDGLNRYDGQHFQVFKPDPNNPHSLSDGWITALYADPAGLLWIGTSQGGLNRYDPVTQQFTRYLHQPKEGSSLSAGEINAILQDQAGTLWIGTDYGLNRFEAAQGSFTRFQNDPEAPDSLSHNQVNALFQDAQGQLWVGTNQGLNRFDPQTETFQRYFNLPTNPASISDATVLALDADAQGNLWIGTANGLNRLAPGSDKFTRYFYQPLNPDFPNPRRINSILIDRQGIIWLGTETGLERFDLPAVKSTFYHHNPLVQDSLSADQVAALYEDREGNLWIGTWGGGINQYNRGQNKFGYYRSDPEQLDSLSDGGVFGLYADPSGWVWVGVYGRGLDRLNPVTGQVTHFVPNSLDPASLGSPTVWAIVRDPQGQLWLGTSAGLEAFDEQTGKFTHHLPDKNNPESLSGKTIFALFVDAAGELWVGTTKGLDRYERSSGKFIHYSQDDQGETPKGIVKITADREGFLWVATNSLGLYRLDPQSGKFQRYLHDPENPRSLSHNKVGDLFQDAQGQLWIGTSGGGLNRFDPATQTFTTYTERQGLANNFIYRLEQDDQGFIWISTNSGLSRFDPGTESFRNFTVSDGLQSNEFNQGASARAADGTLYFGGISGLNAFSPTAVSANSFIPPVRLTSLTRDGQPLETGRAADLAEELTLTWPQNSFEFEFAALSFAEPRNNQFAYQLENFESDWNLLGNQHAGRYTNLPGGTYTLRLKASNNDGLWNETGQTLRVTVIPPFWQTWWFFSLAGVGVAGSLLGVYRWRVRSVEQQKLELEYQVHERTREIESLFEQTKELAIIEERNRLARDLHDSAKQKAFAALAQIGTANGFIEKNLQAAREHLREAEDLVSDVIQELTFLIQEMYPLALKEKGLATSLREYAYEWENRTDIPVSVKIEGEYRLKLEVEQALYRIVQESLANIARHSQASQAYLNVHYHQSRVNLEIADNGRGFVPNHSSNGIGLRLIRERAESIGGQVSLESEPGRGTRVRLEIPTENEKHLPGENHA